MVLAEDEAYSPESPPPATGVGWPQGLRGQSAGGCPQGHRGSGRGVQVKVQASALGTSEGSGKAAGLDVGWVPSPGEWAGQHGVGL